MISLGTADSNPVIRLLLTDGAFQLNADLGDEGYVVKTVELDNEVISLSLATRRAECSMAHMMWLKRALHN